MPSQFVVPGRKRPLKLRTQNPKTLVIKCDFYLFLYFKNILKKNLFQINIYFVVFKTSYSKPYNSLYIKLNRKNLNNMDIKSKLGKLFSLKKTRKIIIKIKITKNKIHKYKNIKNNKEKYLVF